MPPGVRLSFTGVSGTRRLNPDGCCHVDEHLARLHLRLLRRLRDVVQRPAGQPDRVELPEPLRGRASARSASFRIGSSSAWFFVRSPGVVEARVVDQLRPPDRRAEQLPLVLDAPAQIAITIQPSFVGNAWNGVVSGCRVPIGFGASPVAK